MFSSQKINSWITFIIGGLFATQLSTARLQTQNPSALHQLAPSRNVSQKLPPYWEAVKQDINDWQKSGQMIQISKDGITDALGKLIQVQGVSSLEAIQDTFTKFQELVNQLEISILERTDLSKDDERILSLREDRGLLPNPIQGWVDVVYKIKAGEVMGWYWDDLKIEVMEEVMQEVKEKLRRELGMKLCVIRDQFFISPRTQEIIWGDGETIWIGERFLKLIAEEREFEEDFAWLLFQGFQGARYFWNGYDVTAINGIKDLNQPLPILLATSQPWIRNAVDKRVPKLWEPMLPGGNVGKSEGMRNLFAIIHQFSMNDSTTTLLIGGEIGTGKNQLVKAIAEEMGLRSGDVQVFGGRHFTRTADKVNEVLLGAVTEEAGGYRHGLVGKAIGLKNGEFDGGNRGLLVIDDFPQVTEEVQALLVDLLDDDRVVQLDNGEALDIKGLKIVLLCNHQWNSLKGKLRSDLISRINTRVTIPGYLSVETILC